MAKNTDFGRRRFLGYATSASVVGLCRSPAMAMFGAILSGVSQKAWAASVGVSPRSFVDITEPGAPARWMYSSFLSPYSSTGMNLNPMVATRFRNTGGRYIGAQYETVRLKGIDAPYMWSHDLPKVGNTYRPMADLLDNLLCIQGVNTRNAGHGGSQIWNQLPVGAKKSTSAMSADASSAPFAALNVNASSFTFRSTESKTALSLSTGGNMLSSLLDPFRPSGTEEFRVKKGGIREAYDSILPSLDQLARGGHPGAEALIQNRDSALDLVASNFATLDSEWAALLAKYRGLVSRAIYDPSHPLAGINDAPIGEGGSGSAELYRVSDQSLLDLHLAPDLRSAVDARTNVPGLAESFAFTEYVLTNKLSSSIAFGIGGIGPFIRPSDGVAMESMGNDQHTTGLYAATYFNILRHRAIITCVAELIDRLKAQNTFNDTLIRIAGEFSRNPRQDLTGADHGSTGQAISLYSGAFNGPLMVGNLANDGRLGWGAGGVIPELGRQLTLTDTAITIAHLLRVPPPLTSTTPVVTLSSNGLVSNIGRTRFVA